MKSDLSEDQNLLINSLVASGRFSSSTEVIIAGTELLAAEESLRQEVKLGIDQADRGELVDHETVFARLKAMADR
jgi:antitoxin ParD1/3/4